VTNFRKRFINKCDGRSGIRIPAEKRDFFKTPRPAS